MVYFSDTFILLLVLFIVVTLWGFIWFKNDQKRYSKYPPGPPRLPLLGNLLQIWWASSFPAVAFAKLAETYGEVMFLKMGENEAIIFTSSSSIQQILKHEKTVDRSAFEFVKDRHNGKNLGIIFANGESWSQLRRFTIRNLRTFGFGKSSVFDSVMNEEIDKFISHHITKNLQNSNDSILFMEDAFSITVVNVLWRLMSGQSYSYDDPRIRQLLKLNSAFFRSTNVGLDLSDIWPFLRDWFPNWSGRNIQKKASQNLYNYGKSLLEEHRRNKNNFQEPCSFLDVFIDEIEKDWRNTNFTEEQFVMTVLDLLVAGSETSSNVLSFAILYMLLNPKVQEKVQEELGRVLPSKADHHIELNMKSKLPYTTATILEIYRYSTIGPIPIPRRATESFNFSGFYIPKGISIIPDNYAAHFSKKQWKDPEVFRPERFLIFQNDNQKGKEIIINKEAADLLQTFGGGKRICLGESLAESTIFLYFTRLMKQFKWVKVQGTNPTVKPRLAINLFPEPYVVQVLKR